MTILLLAFALAAPATPPEWRLRCVLHSDQDNGSQPQAMEIGIILVADKSGKPKAANFEDSSNIFGSDYGSKPTSSRKWKVKSTGFDGVQGFVDIRSFVSRAGQSARIWLSSDSAGAFKGRYWVNRGMLTESFAEGDSGQATCRISPEKVAPAN